MPNSSNSMNDEIRGIDDDDEQTRENITLE